MTDNKKGSFMKEELLKLINLVEDESFIEILIRIVRGYLEKKATKI